MENNLIFKESGAYKTKSTIFWVWVFRCQPEIDEYEDGQQEAEKGHRIPNLETCVKWSGWLLPSRICVPKVLKGLIFWLNSIPCPTCEFLLRNDRSPKGGTVQREFWHMGGETLLSDWALLGYAPTHYWDTKFSPFCTQGRTGRGFYFGTGQAGYLPKSSGTGTVRKF